MEDLYSEYKIYGPYKRPDGRKHLVLKKAGIKTTLSYPKYLVEVSLGRLLTKDEVVHHVDGDFTNDNPENLEVISRSSHGSVHKPLVVPEQTITECVYCGKQIALTRKQMHYRVQNRNRGHSGPFCSRICSGKYGTDQQY